jgi:hypothetical protein
MIRTNYDGCPGQEKCQNDERGVACAATWAIQSSTESCFPIQTNRPADRRTYGSKGLQVSGEHHQLRVAMAPSQTRIKPVSKKLTKIEYGHAEKGFLVMFYVVEYARANEHLVD